MRGARWRPGFLCVALVVASLPMRALRAQGSCTVTAFAKCATPITLPTPNGSTLTYGYSGQLTVTPAATAWQVSAADVDAGYSQTIAITLAVTSNRAWKLEITGPTTWTVDATAWASKPVSDALWGLSTTTVTTALSTSPSQVTSGVAGTSSTTVYVRTKLAWRNDSPGSYALPMTFTLTLP